MLGNCPFSSMYVVSDNDLPHKDGGAYIVEITICEGGHGRVLVTTPISSLFSLSSPSPTISPSFFPFSVKLPLSISSSLLRLSLLSSLFPYRSTNAFSFAPLLHQFTHNFSINPPLLYSSSLSPPLLLYQPIPFLPPPLSPISFSPLSLTYLC